MSSFNPYLETLFDVDQSDTNNLVVEHTHKRKRPVHNEDNELGQDKCFQNTEENVEISSELTTSNKTDEIISVNEVKEAEAEDTVVTKETKTTKREPSEVDVVLVLSKLASHINSNIKKFSKVIDLVIQLIDAKISFETSQHFLDFLVAIYEQSDAIIYSISIKEIYAGTLKLYESFYDNISYFQDDAKYEFLSYYISNYIYIQLSTDDSFLFSSICTKLKDFIEEVSFTIVTQPASGEQEEVDVETDQLIKYRIRRLLYRKRLQSILKCLEMASKSYFHHWAKQPIDFLFTAASSRRLKWPQDLREKLDDMTTSITVEQRKLLSGYTPKTIRSYNSTSHPVTQKKTGILR